MTFRGKKPLKILILIIIFTQCLTEDVQNKKIDNFFLFYWITEYFYWSNECYLVLLGVLWLLLSRGFELWLLRGVWVKNSLRMNWAWWKAMRHTPAKEKLITQHTAGEKTHHYHTHEAETILELCLGVCLSASNQVKMSVTTQKDSSQLGPGTTWAHSGSMWCGSVTLRVKGKEEPRSVINVRSLITHDDVKSGVNLEQEWDRKWEHWENTSSWMSFFFF